MEIIYGIKNESYVFRASGYAWQSEYRHRRVVRMNTHIDAVLVAYRHYCLQEIYEVGAESVFVNSVIEGKKLLEVRYRGGIVL